jgi:hypothetical protein
LCIREEEGWLIQQPYSTFFEHAKKCIAMAENVGKPQLATTTKKKKITNVTTQRTERESNFYSSFLHSYKCALSC